MPLAPRCTLGVGGAAEWFVEARERAELVEALGFAAARGAEVAVLGGGSNLVVADRGVRGLVVAVATQGVEVLPKRDERGLLRLRVEAGEPWDALAERAASEGWAGLECLSGIPGTVGAAPVQNIGAYGCEARDIVTAVTVYDRRAGVETTLDTADCAFGYRDSVFKRGARGRYIVLAVELALKEDGGPALRHEELARVVAERGTTRPSVDDVRRAVLALRRSKSMVVDPTDPDSRSCGSFFVNPTVSRDALAELRARVAADVAVPCWEQGEGRVKLSAGWLIERAGFLRGLRDGAVGLSSRHALALTATPGATAADVLRLAVRVREGVAARLGVALRPEVEFWGFSPDELAPLGLDGALA